MTSGLPILTRRASSPNLRTAAETVSTGTASGALLRRTVSSPNVIVLNTRALSPAPESSAEIALTKGAEGAALAFAALKKGVERLTTLDAFGKAKASQSYGISTIYYRLILPLKEIIGLTLTPKQAENLELYRKHTALCSGIEKVQKAFKAYTAAQEAADKAPTNPVNAREGARRQAIAAGIALVANYENLIGLAIKQAEEIAGADQAEFFQTDHLKDLHGELDKDTKGLILKTVNTIRPNIDIEDGLLDVKDDSLKAELGKRYKEFVTEFVSKVQEAHCQSGDSSTLSAVTEAFIQGLAAIPELGELDDGLVLIELYGEISQKQTDVAGTQALAIQRQFKAKIEALMNADQPITTEDLQNIQYNGISLQSVKSIDVEELNVLKGLRGQLKEVKKQIQKVQAEIEQRQAIVEKEERYSFADVQAFMNFCFTNQIRVEAPVTLLNASKEDENALDRLAKFYTETLAQLAVINKKKEDIQARQTEALKARDNAFNDNQNQRKKLIGTMLQIDKEIADIRDLADQEKKLAAFEKEIEKESKKLAGEKVSDAIKTLLTTGFKKECDSAKAGMQNEISRLKGFLDSKRKEREGQQEALNKLKLEMKKLFEENDLRDRNVHLALAKLDQDYLALINQNVSFSGKDIKVITEKLDAVFSEEIKILQKSNRVRAAEAGVKILTKRELALQKQADDITNQMTSKPLLLTLNDEQDIVLDPAVFGNKEKVKITTQLESNLVIAKKVTLEVGQEIVRQVNAAYNKSVNEDTGPHKLKLRGGRKFSALELKLNELQALDSNMDNLKQLVQKGVEEFAPVVPKKAVKAKQPLPAPTLQLGEGMDFNDSNNEYDVTEFYNEVIDEDTDDNTKAVGSSLTNEEASVADVKLNNAKKSLLNLLPEDDDSTSSLTGTSKDGTNALTVDIEFEV